MVKKKKSTRRKKSDTKIAPQHTLPTGFWLQISAIVLVVVALLFVIAMFNAGGPILAWVYHFIQQIIGWAVYALPILFIFIAIEIFRTEENRISVVVTVATVVFIIFLASFLQLFSSFFYNLFWV